MDVILWQGKRQRPGQMLAIALEIRLDRRVLDDVSGKKGRQRRERKKLIGLVERKIDSIDPLPSKNCAGSTKASSGAFHVNESM